MDRLDTDTGYRIQDTSGGQADRRAVDSAVVCIQTSAAQCRKHTRTRPCAVACWNCIIVVVAPLRGVFLHCVRCLLSVWSGLFRGFFLESFEASNIGCTYSTDQSREGKRVQIEAGAQRARRDPPVRTLNDVQFILITVRLHNFLHHHPPSQYSQQPRFLHLHLQYIHDFLSGKTRPI